VMPGMETVSSKMMTSAEMQVEYAEAHLKEQRAKVQKGTDKSEAFTNELFKNRNDYLKLFLTQMKCQTPDKPMDPADMMAALGQMA
ncbi:hypothetical protein GN156_32840, partial [bacterium LRH843]|nr:hypothetical protein [bacterium LRH843]